MLLSTISIRKKLRVHFEQPPPLIVGASLFLWPLREFQHLSLLLLLFRLSRFDPSCFRRLYSFQEKATATAESS